MANKYRNEVDVTLNGTKYTLRPSFEVIATIEEHTKQSIFHFVATATAGLFKFSDAYVVFEAAIKAGGDETNLADLKANMSQGGLNEVAVALNAFLVSALNPGAAAKKN